MKQQAMAVVLLVLGAGLVLSGCSALDGLGPSAPVEPLAGRVEVPEAGIAVTFPDDWLRESPPSLASGGLAALLESEQRDLLVPLIAAVPPTMHDRCVVADIARLVAARPEWQTLDDVVAGLARPLATDVRWVDADSAILELPAGPTGRITRAVAGESASVTTYIFTRAGGWYTLECLTQTVPPPDWRPVAMSFEFLPGEG